MHLNLIEFHTITMLVSFVLCSSIMILPKGTKFHKITGRIFVIIMLLSLISTFFITGLTGSWNFVHVLSLYCLFCIIRAVIAIRLKRNNWREIHGFYMISTINAIIIAAAGVVGRHYIFPGSPEYGFIVSIIIAIPTIIISLSQKKNLLK